MTLDAIIQLAATVVMGITTFTMTNILTDIREIRKDLKDHANDHEAHCKGFNHLKQLTA